MTGSFFQDGFNRSICNRGFGRKDFFLDRVKSVHPECQVSRDKPEEADQSHTEIVVEASAAFESASGQILVLSEERYRKLEENGFVNKADGDQVLVENAEIVESEAPETVSHGDESQVVVQGEETGQDAVQTLIDAVENLIQHHESSADPQS